MPKIYVILNHFKKINFQILIAILAILITPIVAQSADVTIDKISSGLLGNRAEISINIDNIPFGIEYSGFDFLVAFDSRYLGLTSVEPGEFISIETLEWEYFTYRLEFDVDCTTADCPKALIHIFAQQSLDWQNPGDGPLINVVGELAKLNFIVSYSSQIECQFLPISFYWETCQNNTLTKSENIPDISNLVFDYNGLEISQDQEFPSWTGASNQCQVSGIDRTIDFYNGGIDIACVDNFCQGDINMNSLLFEIGDKVLFENYFVYGLVVFDINIEGQIAATDINCDGISLSVPDLIYLQRVITRDLLPFINCCF